MTVAPPGFQRGQDHLSAAEERMLSTGRVTRCDALGSTEEGEVQPAGAWCCTCGHLDASGLVTASQHRERSFPDEPRIGVVSRSVNPPAQGLNANALLNARSTTTDPLSSWVVHHTDRGDVVRRRERRQGNSADSSNGQQGKATSADVPRRRILYPVVGTEHSPETVGILAAAGYMPSAASTDLASASSSSPSGVIVGSGRSSWSAR